MTDDDRTKYHKAVMEMSNDILKWALDMEEAPDPRVFMFALAATIARLCHSLDADPDVLMEYIAVLHQDLTPEELKNKLELN